MSVHLTKSGKWEARYREGRRNRSKTFDLEEDARAFDIEARTRRQRGEHIRRSSDTPTFALKTNQRIFEKHLDPYLGGQRVADLNPRRLDAWRRELEGAGSASTC